MTPIVLAVLLTLAQAAPAPPVPPVPPAAPAPPVSAWEEAAEPSGYLGVIPADVTRADCERLGLKTETGALVRRVVEKGPAAEAGIVEGDVILAFGGAVVTSAAQLRRLVRETPGGRTTTVELFRDGKRLPLKVTLAAGEGVGRVHARPDRYLDHPDHRPFRIIVEKELEGSQDDMARALEDVERALEEADLERNEVEIHLKNLEEGLEHIKRIPLDPDHPMLWVEKGPDERRFRFQFQGTGKPRLGVGLQDLTDQLAAYFGLKDRSGVLITSVSEGSAAAKAGLKAGDVVLSIGGTAVEGSGDVQRLVAQAGAGALEVKVLREKKEMTLRPVLEAKEEKVTVKEKRVQHTPKEQENQKHVIIRVGEPGASSI